MSSAFAGLRAWWLVAGLALAGWALVATGAVLIGGLVMAFAFAVAALLRLTNGDQGRVGALAVRVRPLDLWLYTTAAVNIAGASLLVTRHLEVAAFVVAEAALIIWGAAVVARMELARHRTPAHTSN